MVQLDIQNKCILNKNINVSQKYLRFRCIKNYILVTQYRCFAKTTELQDY